MYWQYFRWQMLRDPLGEHQRTQRVLAAALLVLGLAGGAAHWKRHRASWWYFAPLVFLLSVGLVYYMNFKYGSTQAPELGGSVPREVRDRDYFFLWSFSAWAVWVALGLVWLWDLLRPRARIGQVAVAGAILLFALVPLAANWRAASRRGDRTAIAFARDLLNSVEPYGVLVTGGDNDTFPLWYAQEVEGVRRDVTVYLLELLNTDWYVRGLIRRPVHAYDEARGPAIYRGLARARPTGPVLRMTLAEADSVPAFMQLSSPMTFAARGIRAVIDPRALPSDGAGGGYLTRGDLLLLRMIADNYGERPVYFSRTAGDVGGPLGLSDHLVAQGMVRRLVATPPTGGRDTVPVQGGGWFDVARSLALWNQVYGAPAALARKGSWVDEPSLSIPLGYVLTGAELAGTLSMRGDTTAARAVLQDVRAVGRAVRQEALVERLLAGG